jgi:hypothetical protein
MWTRGGRSKLAGGNQTGRCVTLTLALHVLVKVGENHHFYNSDFAKASKPRPKSYGGGSALSAHEDEDGNWDKCPSCQDIGPGGRWNKCSRCHVECPQRVSASSLALWGVYF